MTKPSAPFQAMIDNFEANFEAIKKQNIAASQTHYGLKEKEGRAIPFLSPARLAAQLDVSPKTLERMRNDGTGPPFVKITNKRIRYPLVELEKWLTANLLQKRADQPGATPITSDKQGS